MQEVIAITIDTVLQTLYRLPSSRLFWGDSLLLFSPFPFLIVVIHRRLVGWKPLPVIALVVRSELLGIWAIDGKFLLINLGHIFLFLFSSWGLFSLIRISEFIESDKRLLFYLIHPSTGLILYISSSCALLDFSNEPSVLSSWHANCLDSKVEAPCLLPFRSYLAKSPVHDEGQLQLEGRCWRRHSRMVGYLDRRE